MVINVSGLNLFGVCVSANIILIRLDLSVFNLVRLDFIKKQISFRLRLERELVLYFYRFSSHHVLQVFHSQILLILSLSVYLHDRLV